MEILLTPDFNKGFLIGILTLLTFSITFVGSFLVYKLRIFFQENYYKHSLSIIVSIVVQVLGLGSFLSSCCIIMNR